MPWLACQAGMLLDVQDGEHEASTFGTPDSLWRSYSSYSSTAFMLLLHQLPQTFPPLLSPWLFAGGSRAVAHKCQRSPLLGQQQRGTAHGLCTQALAEQGRRPGALSGYNLGTINRGSKGSCFLFLFYPLQCFC